MPRLFGAIVIASVSVVIAVPVNAGLEDDIIRNKCAAAMRSEYERAGKQLLLSDLNSTCDCVVREIDNHRSIAEAKAFCTE